MSKIVSEFEYNSLVTPELITQISNDILIELEKTFKGICIKDFKSFIPETVSSMMDVASFIEVYLNQLECKGIIPECFGTFIPFFDKDTQTLNITYEKPFFVKQPLYAVGYTFYVVDVTDPFELITKYTIIDVIQKNQYNYYKVIYQYGKNTPKQDLVGEYAFTYKKHYKTFTEAQKELDSMIDNWVITSVEDIEYEAQEKKLKLKDMEEF
jgi:hypothetical protein